MCNVIQKVDRKMRHLPCSVSLHGHFAFRHFPCLCLSGGEILKLYCCKRRLRYGEWKTSPRVPHFVISWQLANGADSRKTAAYNLSHEQEYCRNLVINSVTQHILPSCRLSRPRPRDFRFVIYSFIAGTRVSSFVCNELHSCLCFNLLSCASLAKLFAYGQCQPPTMLASDYNYRCAWSFPIVIRVKLFLLMLRTHTEGLEM